MDDNSPFWQWFKLFRETRDDTQPIGWYSLDELRTSFHAGQSTITDQLSAQVSRLERALNELRHKD